LVRGRTIRKLCVAAAAAAAAPSLPTAGSWIMTRTYIKSSSSNIKWLQQPLARTLSLSLSLPLSLSLSLSLYPHHLVNHVRDDSISLLTPNQSLSLLGNCTFDIVDRISAAAAAAAAAAVRRHSSLARCPEATFAAAAAAFANQRKSVAGIGVLRRRRQRQWRWAKIGTVNTHAKKRKLVINVYSNNVVASYIYQPKECFLCSLGTQMQCHETQIRCKHQFSSSSSQLHFLAAAGDDVDPGFCCWKDNWTWAIADGSID
jgi:hypothetical protein